MKWLNVIVWSVVVAGCAWFWLGLGRATVDLGGSVADYLDRAMTSYSRIDGVCASACTMLLHNGCVYPDAVLMFHAGTTNLGTDVMRRMYPPRVRAWVDARGALDTPNITRMSGREAIALGVPRC